MKRPAGLAQDTSTVVEVCLQTLADVEASGPLPDAFCCVYATAVFITADDLCRSKALLDADDDTNLIMGVSEYGLPPVQALTANADGFLEYKWPEYKDMKSHDYPHLVVSNGTLYWGRTGPFRRSPTFYGDRLKGYLLPRERAVDIDTPEDLAEARHIAKRLIGKSP